MKCRYFRWIVKHLLLHAFLVLFLSACGGSSKNNSHQSAQVDSPIAAKWESGQFTSQAAHAALCEAPRSGVEPFSGEPFADRPGTTLDEKLWLRAFTYETYLWFDEVPDNDPELFSVPAYFNQLKTTELTQSGNLKDNFHFSVPTADNNQRSQGGVISGYGINWAFNRFSPPRSLVVRYNETGSPADQAGIQRGATLSKINGIDFIHSTSSSDIDTFNEALFPSGVGELYTFTFITPDNEEQVVTLASEDNIPITAVQNVRVLSTDVGRVGYMQYNTFNRHSQSGLITAFTQFNEQNIDELVIDLRYNGGGLLVLSAQIAYMIAGSQNTSNKTYYQSQSNNKVRSSRPLGFVDVEIDYDNNRFTNRKLPSVDLSRVYILATENTCSASEAVINGLKGVGVEVVLIGNKTCGKPFSFIPEDNCGQTYFIIQSQGVNNTGFGDYVNGFIPTQSPTFDDEVLGCRVNDDLNHLLGSPDEAVLAGALQHIASGTCPPAVSARIEHTPSHLEYSIREPLLPAKYILIDDRALFKK